MTVRLDLSVEALQARWPRLYHLTEIGSWPSIERHGLLSTAALLDLFGVQEFERDRWMSQRRPDMVRLERPGVGVAYLRDNKPMNETVLRRTLVGMDVANYYRALNSRVFFFWRSQRCCGCGPHRRTEIEHTSFWFWTGGSAQQARRRGRAVPVQQRRSACWRDGPAWPSALLAHPGVPLGRASFQAASDR